MPKIRDREALRVEACEVDSDAKSWEAESSNADFSAQKSDKKTNKGAKMKNTGKNATKTTAKGANKNATKPHKYTPKTKASLKS